MAMRKRMILLVAITFIVMVLMLGGTLGFLLKKATSQFSAASSSFEVSSDRQYAEESIGAPTSSSRYATDSTMNAPMAESTKSVAGGGGGASQGADDGAIGPQHFDAMFFQDYGTNLFIPTRLDPVSTFGVDVDTASYTIAKNYIMRGSLPPTDAIRAEEFINYPDYEYEAAFNDSASSLYHDTIFAVHATMTDSPFDEDTRFLSIGLKAQELAKRKPTTLTFVIDISGSMSRDNRLGLVKRSLYLLLDELDERDEVSIIVYNTNARKHMEMTTLSEKETIESAIDRLSASGSTNAEAGLELGYKTALEHLEDGRNNRVVLLSDGVANVGATDPDSILHELEEYHQKGIMLTCIGVGMGNYNDVLLEQIADNGDGNYYYINEFDEARRVFSENLAQTMQTVAKDAKVQVTFSDRVSRYRLIGYENRALADKDFTNDSKDAGEIGAGHEVTALYELELNGTGSVGKIAFRYQGADSNITRSMEKDLPGETLAFDQAPSYARKAVAMGRFALILKMAAPPPSISTVGEILSSMDDPYEINDVVTNTKGLIEARQEVSS